ncbi:hypothetical protein D3C85_1826950 [compost metagenome]
MGSSISANIARATDTAVTLESAHAIPVKTHAGAVRVVVAVIEPPAFSFCITYISYASSATCGAIISD